MATINFDDYFIDELEYKKNKSFDNENTETFDISNDFSATIAVKQNIGLVSLYTKLGNLDNPSSPFFIKIILRGLFEFQMGEEEGDFNDQKFKNMLSSNAIAILYPYLRSLVTDITTKSNEFPPYILPVTNFAQMLIDSDNVQFIDFDEFDENIESSDNYN